MTTLRGAERVAVRAALRYARCGRRKILLQPDDKGTALVQHPHVELIFYLAVAFSLAALTLLALPLVGLAKDAARPRSPGTGAVVAVASGGWSHLEVELSVQGRLYGERRDLDVTPIPRPAAVEQDRLIQGRYRLLEQLGTGGMASVYRARDDLLKRDVAVKLIAERFADDPPFVERFRREARLCARLAHPNILAVLDAGDEPRDFIVTELVDGLDAGRLLQRHGRLTAGETVHVVVQACEALQYAHEQGVVHCDLAPPNILLRRSDGTAKLADFGLASQAVDVASTGAEEAMGTPGYVAPEVLWGNKPTPRSDLYSIGVVAYRLLAGPPEFRPRGRRATSPLATAAPRMPPLAEARPDLPRGLIVAVQQAMAFEVGSRQDSVAEFRAQLLDGRKGSHRLVASSSDAPRVARGELPRAA